MKLSELLPKYLEQYDFKLNNEQEFMSLGLVGSNTGSKKCTFVDSADYIDGMPDDVSMVITTKEFADSVVGEDRGVCIVDSPRIVYFKLHNALSKIKPYARPDFKTVIGKNCKIHNSAVIADTNIKIGNNVIIEEFVVIRENTIIGDNCIIRTGVKIGNPDFEFKRDGESIFGVEHCGGVIIGSNVEILPNTGVNKALYPWDDTIIGDSCKIDMLCNVSHGAKIGKNTMIVALSGVGGRTVIGENCWIGYGAILRNGINIGDNARVNMGAVVSTNVADNKSVTGNFAIDHEKFMSELKNRAR